mgnify:CR=1 FL=1
MNYYTNERSEIIPYIPENCSTFLEVGCGEGNFAALLKKRKNSEVWGIELNNNAAQIAKTKIDKIFIGDFNTLLKELPKNYFDCIVFNDVLEHFEDPFKILQNLKEILVGGGYIVSSIPNVRYIGNLKELLFYKDWKYKQEGGILDMTHLRFFTKKSIIRMFEEAGYKIKIVEGINKYDRLIFVLFNILTFRYFEDTKYLQYACVAQKFGS